MASKRGEKASAKAFQAVLERMQSELRWVIARIPFDAAKLWGKRGQIRVKGEINGFTFRTSLFPTREGGHFLLVNKKMQSGAKAGPGVAAKFKLEPDTEERPVEMPVELEKSLGELKALRKYFDQLNPSRRRDLCRWVLGVKSAEARQRRAAQAAEQLLATMDAERELPPILRLAFARDPGAYRGWQKMPASHRRAHLFGLFYYRTPEAQQRRIGKLIEAAYAYGTRTGTKARGAEAED
jgi:uncharacterized protein YdeI (YjbR/CyaY-like superfamily)